ncbi:MAG: Multisubunit Na+/H+ antiporter MnhG subunit [Candidatus Methanohalarchaeum thermophilum]|uniref:Multisubunit Na+/H+ antiporter MnhG subunit n=1 Tax=Methanohalarchaeum thermophilum TaxID=1903181 RepID=A0A1Q6DUW2_METT1|nr:MAG: Multisubunit Na+/H+ antiporter MnhG subunit [Candidatus Methanohalarchaeum thermophilum]
MLIIGSFFFLVGFIGLNRFPDVFSRLHATTKCDTLGSGSILLSVIIYEGLNFKSAKILLIIVFLFLANPTTSHIIARGTYKSKQKGLKDIDFDEYKKYLKGNREEDED